MVQQHSLETYLWDSYDARAQKLHRSFAPNTKYISKFAQNIFLYLHKIYISKFAQNIFLHLHKTYIFLHLHKIWNWFVSNQELAAVSSCKSMSNCKSSFFHQFVTASGKPAPSNGQLIYNQSWMQTSLLFWREKFKLQLICSSQWWQMNHSQKDWRHICSISFLVSAEMVV